MKILITLLFLGLITGIVAAGDGGQQPATSWMGNRSSMTEPQEVVIRNSEDWQKLWSQIHGTLEPMPSVPTIDFSTHMVVGYFLGQRSSGGYSVSIEEVLETGDAITVTLTTTRPGRNSIVSQALTSPYAIQAIPKNDKNVIFKLSGQ